MQIFYKFENGHELTDNVKNTNIDTLIEMFKNRISIEDKVKYRLNYANVEIYNKELKKRESVLELYLKTLTENLASIDVIKDFDKYTEKTIDRINKKENEINKLEKNINELKNEIDILQNKLKYKTIDKTYIIDVSLNGHGGDVHIIAIDYYDEGNDFYIIDNNYRTHCYYYPNVENEDEEDIWANDFEIYSIHINNKKYWEVDT
jgi:hypothetical protein